MANVSVQRMQDGRHAVIADGNVVGTHKSIWSAARQIHDYYPDGGSEQAGEEASEPKAEAEAEGDRPVMPRPSMPRPPQAKKPKPDVKRIPRP